MNMRQFIFTIFISLAAAWSIHSEPKGHHYLPATPRDSRSPCPGLNALANHGWLPRSGENISLQDIQNAVVDAYNFERHSVDNMVKPVYDFKLSTTGNESTFNLDDLKKHDTIEFDGSLSRNDYLVSGDALHFNPRIWHTTAKAMGLYKFGWTPQSRLVTIEMAAKARAVREAEAKTLNKQFNASVAQQQGTFGTSALYLMTLWDDKVNATHKSWVRSFFEQERIPYFEGFTRPQIQRTSEKLLGFFTALQKVPV